MKIYKTACRGCHGGCLFDLTVEDGKVTKAVPSKDGPLNKGRACVKGLSIIEQMYHPDRLLYPQKRIGSRGSGKWQRISWDEAYATIAEKVNALIKENGTECVSTLTGTGRHHLPYLARFGNAIGTPNATSAGGLICLGPRKSASKFTSGLFGGVDYYGKVRPKGIIVWGANPAISGADGELQWFIKDAVNEGIPLLVIDPQPTELALKAKFWLKVRPGTDGALALGILNIIIENQWYDKDFVENYSVGFDELKMRCKQFPPEKVAQITDLTVEEIMSAAQWIGTTKPLALEQGCAFEQSTNAFDTSRAIAMLLAITGNYDVPGGYVESMEIVPAGVPMTQNPKVCEGTKDLTLGYPYLKKSPNAHPYEMLESIKTGFIKALFIHANNTLLSFADAKHTYECLKKLEFFVYMDIFMNPTAELADIVLPAALWPEVNCIFAMPEFGDQAVLSQQKVVQVGECKSDEEFFIEMCKAAGWDYGYEKHEDMLGDQIKEMVRRRPGLSEYTLEKLQEKGYIAPERTYLNYKKNGFRTPSGKYEFYSERLKNMGIDPVPNWKEPPYTPISRPDLCEEYPLILITGGRQQPYFISNNRQMKSLRKREPFPLVKMSPKTANEYGIKDGQWIWIENENGRITQKAKIVRQMKDGVVNCDFAWWYPEAGAPGYGWDESNANILTCAKPPYDSYMGAYQLRALLCKIYPNPECTIEKRYERWINE